MGCIITKNSTWKPRRQGTSLGTIVPWHWPFPIGDGFYYYKKRWVFWWMAAAHSSAQWSRDPGISKLETGWIITKTHLEYGGYFGGRQRHISRHNGHVIRRVPIGGGLDLLPVADLAGVAPFAHEDVLLFESLGAELEVVLHAHHVALPQHLKTKYLKLVGIFLRKGRIAFLHLRTLAIRTGKHYQYDVW